MKNKLMKILSIVLSIAVVLSVCGISGLFNATAVDQTTDKITDYYVGYSANGSGTGLTADSPVGSIGEAVTLINNNGLTANDTANIWIVQDIDTVQALKADTKKSKHNIASWSTDNSGVIPTHAAKLHIEAYSGNKYNTTDVENTVQTTYIANGPIIGEQTVMYISGPTEFDNVCIVYPSSSNLSNIDGKAHIIIDGNSVVFGEGVTYAYINQNTNGTNLNAVPNSRSSLNTEIGKSDNITEYDNDVKVVFNGIGNDSIVSVPARGGIGNKTAANMSNTFKGNVTIEINNKNRPGGGRVKVGANEDTGDYTYEGVFKKNLNFKLSGIGSFAFSVPTNQGVIVEGGVHVIQDKNASFHSTNNHGLENCVFTDNTYQQKSDYWLLKVDEARIDAIDFQGEKGKFQVSADASATATDAEGNTYTSDKNGVLDLSGKPGEYTVSITVKTYDYYVKGGANGTGMSETDPAGSIATAVTNMVASGGLTADDTANIWIMQDIEAPALTETKTSGVAKHNLAYYGSVPTHNATIVIKPHKDNQKNNPSLTTTYVATNVTMGTNTVSVLGGPTVFEDVYLLYTSNNSNHNGRSVWQLNGNSTTFGNGVKFGYIDKNSNTGYSWTGTITDVNMPLVDLAKSSGENTYPNPVYVKLAVPNASAVTTNKIEIGSYGAGTHVFKEDVTIEFDHPDQYGVQAVIGGNNAGSVSTFEKNLNFRVTSGRAIRFGSGAGTVNVNGAVQLIANKEVGYKLSGNADASITTVADKFLNKDGTAAADMWIVKASADDVKNIDFIDGVKGKFSVPANVIAVAKHEDGTTIAAEDGVLNLSEKPGSYTVEFTVVREKVYDYYVKAGGTGDGTDINNPAPDVATAITTMNSLDLTAEETANIWIIQGDAPARGELVSSNEKRAYHNQAYWSADGKVEEHDAKIIVKPYSENASTTYLFTGDIVGDQDILILGGPTEIDGLTVVVPHLNGQSNRGIIVNGKDYVAGANLEYAYIDKDGNHGFEWTGKLSSVKFLSLSLAQASVDGSFDKPFTITLNHQFNYAGSSIQIPSTYDGTYTFDDNVTINLSEGTNLGYISTGTTKNTSDITFKKNINIKVNGGTLRFNNASTPATMKIVGGLQFITTDKTKLGQTTVGDAGKETDHNFHQMTDYCLNEDGTAPASVWVIKTAAENLEYVNFQGETGKFTAIKDGLVATAVSADKSVIVKADENGVINLSNNVGEYTITFAEEENETHNYDQGENPFINYRGFSEFSGITTADGEAIDYSGALANTYKKLTQDKELNVVYFGGSVTAGTGSTDGGSWRARIGEWLVNNFPNATINNINKAIGETGTYLGAYRVKRDIVSAAPDLLFIEYSINDYYDKASYDRASTQFETIVRAVKEAYPDCDIVTVLVTDTGVAKAAAKGTLHTQARAHEDIAQRYDITSLHVGRVFAEKVTAEGWTSGVDAVWSQYMTDIVHPNNAGYDVYYQVIKEFMANCLLFSNYGECNYEVKNQAYPELFNKYLFDGDVTYIDEYDENSDAVTFENNGNIFHSPTMQGITYPDYEGLLRVPAGCQDIVTVKFTGTELLMLMKAGDGKVEGNKYSVRIDGGEWVSYDYLGKNPTVLAKGLEDGAHVAEIKVSPEEILISTDYRISGFYSRSVIKATNKLNICDLVALDESISNTELDYRDYNNDDVIDAKDITTIKKILLNKK